ncbi:MAG: 16S rRNA (guanine(966)-N(2))-methyltransferase RsmD [Dehalococcoidia bacterium]|nr:16S rRNA (guanine(966)-N(2))-methyltransferase RsmD [Dehalococcoidia bacterium]
MRVAGGSARGIELRAPSSRKVRPATGLVREAIFSMIESSDCACDTVLDLFAGTGALGIEALSRGASWADFIDRNHECCTIIKQNLASTHFADRAGVHCASASRAVEMLERHYDVVLLDPPYDEPSTDTLLSHIGASTLLAPGALVVVSHGNRHPLSDTHGDVSIWKKRRYGDSHIFIYRKEEQ